MVKLVLLPWQASLSPLISCRSASTNWRPFFLSFLPSFPSFFPSFLSFLPRFPPFLSFFPPFLSSPPSSFPASRSAVTLSPFSLAAPVPPPGSPGGEPAPTAPAPGPRECISAAPRKAVPGPRAKAVLMVAAFPYTSAPPRSTPCNSDGSPLLNEIALDACLGLLLRAVLQMPWLLWVQTCPRP